MVYNLSSGKSDLEGRKTMALSGLHHKYGTPFGENEKLQVKWLLNELRQKLGIDIHWQKDKNGIVRGYGIVDHKTRMAFDGSRVLRMAEWMDAGLRENMEKGQKVKGQTGEIRRKPISNMSGDSSIGESKGMYGLDPRISKNIDSISIAKHKNGKYYLRVSFKDFCRSEMFFLSQEETRAFLLAKDAAERALLKLQLAVKYLLQAMGGSRDQNREWEVGRSDYEFDDHRSLKR